jgi:hypothetical protein
VEVIEAGGQGECEAQAFVELEMTVSFQVFLEGMGDIGLDTWRGRYVEATGDGVPFWGTGLCAGVVREFHDVVEVAFGIIATCLKDGDVAWMRPGNGLDALDAIEFTVVGAVGIERGAIDNLDGTERAEDVTSQPDFAVGAAADGAQENVIGDTGRWLMVAGVGGCRGRMLRGGGRRVRLSGCPCASDWAVLRHMEGSI